LPPIIIDGATALALKLLPYNANSLSIARTANSFAAEHRELHHERQPTVLRASMERVNQTPASARPGKARSLAYDIANSQSGPFRATAEHITQ
jgi:hypothetical protein